MADFPDGIYSSAAISHADYLRLPHLTNSGIKLLCQSPMDFWGDKHGLREPYETKATSFGTMAHVYLLEGERVFNQRYAVKPDGLSFATKAGKEWRAEYPENTIFIKQADLAKVQLTARIIAQIPEYSDLLAGGEAETTLIWTEKHDDIAVKCAARCDILGPQGIVDLKTFSPFGAPLDEAIGAAIARYKYFVQCQWYLRGLAALHEQGMAQDYPCKFAFLFVQSDGIPNIAVRYIEQINGMVPAYMRQGDAYIKKGLAVYVENMQTHGWEASRPWLAKNIGTLMDDDLPKYALDKEIEND